MTLLSLCPFLINVKYVDYLPTGLTYLRLTNSVWSCSGLIRNDWLVHVPIAWPLSELLTSAVPDHNLFQQCSSLTLAACHERWWFYCHLMRFILLSTLHDVFIIILINLFLSFQLYTLISCWVHVVWRFCVCPSWCPVSPIQFIASWVDYIRCLRCLTTCPTAASCWSHQLL